MKNDLSDVIPAQKGPRTRSTRFPLIAHGLAWGLFAASLGFGVPRFEAIFADFGVPLPRVAILAIQGAHLVVKLGPYVLFPLVVLLVTDWFVLDSLSRWRDVGMYWAWSVLVLVFPLFMIVMTFLALLLPFLTVMERLSG